MLPGSAGGDGEMMVITDDIDICCNNCGTKYTIDKKLLDSDSYCIG